MRNPVNFFVSYIPLFSYFMQKSLEYFYCREYEYQRLVIFDRCGKGIISCEGLLRDFYIVC